MKYHRMYIILFIIVCVSCKPINTSIGIRKVYTSPKFDIVKNKMLPNIDLLLQEPAQEFRIHSNADTILYGTNGTTIYFHPLCLQTQIATPYNGMVHLELKELFTKKALLKERAYTISNGSMLESDGALYINAKTETGDQLIITCDEGIQIQIPRDVKPNMIYFNGSRNSSGNMNWNVSDSIVTIAEDFDLDTDDTFFEEGGSERSPLQKYFFRTKKFGWINCDRFYDDIREKVDLLARFILPTYEKKCTEIQNYIVFDSLMCVLPLQMDESGQWICPLLPLGEIVTCISIQKSDQHLYYGIQKTRIGNSSLLIALKEVKEEELMRLLELNL